MSAGNKPQPYRKTPQPRRWNRQLVSLLLVLALIGGVVTLQWARPDAAEALRQQCATLLLGQTDFEESIAALGEALMNGTIAEAVEAWCAGLFTPQAADPSAPSEDSSDAIPIET